MNSLGSSEQIGSDSTLISLNVKVVFLEQGVYCIICVFYLFFLISQSYFSNHF